jgi:hypothetical protein
VINPAVLYNATTVASRWHGHIPQMSDLSTSENFTTRQFVNKGLVRSSTTSLCEAGHVRQVVRTALPWRGTGECHAPCLLPGRG